MFRRIVALCVVLGFASVAQAGAVIELTALTPPDQGTMYSGGLTVDFQAAISTDRGVDTQVRLWTLDFSASDTELTFAGPDNDGDTVPEFILDFSSITLDIQYEKFPNYPLVSATYGASSPTPGFILVVPAQGSLVLGTGSVVLPAEGSVEVEYFVDALNAGSDDTNNNISARLDFDFDDPTNWNANGSGSDLITGEALGLTVIPEPATLLLLGLGGVAVLRRRR